MSERWTGGSVKAVSNDLVRIPWLEYPFVLGQPHISGSLWTKVLTGALSGMNKSPMTRTSRDAMIAQSILSHRLILTG